MGRSSWGRVRVGEVTCMRGQRRAPETWARTASRSGRRGSHFTRLGRYYLKGSGGVAKTQTESYTIVNPKSLDL